MPSSDPDVDKFAAADDDDQLGLDEERLQELEAQEVRQPPVVIDLLGSRLTWIGWISSFLKYGPFPASFWIYFVLFLGTLLDYN